MNDPYDCWPPFLNHEAMQNIGHGEYHTMLDLACTSIGELCKQLRRTPRTVKRNLCRLHQTGRIGLAWLPNGAFTAALLSPPFTPLQ
jgi:hypothetical protein